MLFSRRIITTEDHERLVRAVERASDSWLSYTPHLDLFRRELRRARKVAPSDVPGDVITMDTWFVLSHPRDSGSIVCTLVYPEQETMRRSMVSVLSPMGMSLLGARVGEEVCWMSSDGPELATVLRLIYQPEAPLATVRTEGEPDQVTPERSRAAAAAGRAAVGT